MNIRSKLIILLFCAGLLFKHLPCNAQYSNTNSTTKDTSSISTAIIAGVILGVIVVALIVNKIKNHSSADFKMFKREIKAIDNLMADKNTIIKNRNAIHSAFSNAGRYYYEALRDPKANKAKLSERKAYCDQLQRVFNQYLKAYFEPQYKTLKNQFFDNITKCNNDVANTILNKNILSLFNEWKIIDISLNGEYLNEIDAMVKILSSSNTIKKIQSSEFDRLNAISNY